MDNQGLVESGGQSQGCMSGDAAFRHGRGIGHVYGCVAGVGFASSFGPDQGGIGSRAWAVSADGQAR